MQQQKPSIGRVVHYVTRANGKENVFAALITEVLTEERVMLAVFFPNERGSVPREALLEGSQKAMPTGFWRWPPFVKPAPAIEPSAPVALPAPAAESSAPLASESLSPAT